jgi:hypothetical protein
MVFAFTIYMYRAEYIFIGAILDRTSIYIYIPTYIWCHLIYKIHIHIPKVYVYRAISYRVSIYIYIPTYIRDPMNL